MHGARDDVDDRAVRSIDRELHADRFDRGGVIASLVLTGVLATVSVAATHLTGVVSEDDLFFSTGFRNVNMQGLLLAAILVGSLGVLDDVAVTQAVTVAELVQANPALRPLALYRSAMRVGRAHIASVINTIILAYAGASLPVLLLITATPAGGGLVTKKLSPLRLKSEFSVNSA